MPALWLVDDTFLDRLLVREVLASDHPHVAFRGFASVAEVAAACTSLDDDVALVLTDVRLAGGERGADVLSRIRTARPEIPVVVWSGLVTDAIRREYTRLGADEILEKPGDLSGLRAILARLLPSPARLSA